MKDNLEKSKRISLYFNENDQRAVYVYDILQKQGRKKTKFIIDLILSNLETSLKAPDINNEKSKPVTKNRIKIFDPNTNVSEKDLSVTPLPSMSLNSDSNSVPVSNTSSISDISENFECNSSKVPEKATDDYWSIIMNGLNAFN